MKKLLIIFFAIIYSNIAFAKNNAMDQDLFCAGALIKMKELIISNQHKYAFEGELKDQLSVIVKNMDNKSTIFIKKYTKPNGEIPAQGKALFDKGVNFSSNEVGDNILIGLSQGTPQFQIIFDCLKRANDLK